ncbi:DUF1285 domain-containing protein [Phaeovulum sp.]|uniref:DUF1285 domain-containing protein n=1 Tax=Phaeovulum sp. TaxID=2934796 RepID=UPI003567541B
MTEKTPAQNPVKPSAEGLAAAAGEFARKGPPPLHLWNPPFCGDIDMEIRRDGNWFYLGTPIGRAPLVRLFASILRREGDDYFLVNPVEKVGIRVEDAPFIAVDAEASGEDEAQAITFTTNVEDSVTAGPDHPIRCPRDPETGEPAPYVMVRAGLEARIDRKTFYRLVELARPAPYQGETWLGLWSGGSFFPLIPATELR